eukprot:5991214-Prymnesium_polylepis.1
MCIRDSACIESVQSSPRASAELAESPLRCHRARTRSGERSERRAASSVATPRRRRVAHPCGGGVGTLPLQRRGAAEGCARGPVPSHGAFTHTRRRRRCLRSTCRAGQSGAPNCVPPRSG